MKACGSFGGKPQPELDGIAALERDRLSSPPTESYRSAGEHVNRGDHLELLCYHASMLS